MFSQRMVVWVRNGKGSKDRSVPLPPQTLAQLRAYWSEHRPKIWLLPSKEGTSPITKNRVQRRLKSDTEARLQAREKELLPVPYYHVIFTLPHELREFARRHQKQVYGLLIKCAADSILKLAADPPSSKI